MKLISRIVLSASLILVLGACKKVEGPGGSSSIIGKLHAIDRDGFGNVIAEYDIAKEDLYIIYGGENTMYDDDIETSYDGSFRFEFLENGVYQLFYYSDCLPGDCDDGKEAIIHTVEITEKKSVVDLGTLTIYK